MISDLDESIKQLLIKKGQLGSSEVDITYETPDREWSASLSKPTINLYLYDIRENLDLRSMEWIVSKTSNNMATKRVNARRINLSYLVTVWANNVEDQHNLLWRVMVTLYQYPTFPREFLTGQLVEQEYPIITQTAQPNGLLNNPFDFWGALNNEIKPSFNYVVTLPMDMDIAFTSAIARTRTLSVKGTETEAETMTGISGIVHYKGKPEKVIAGVEIEAKDAGLTCKTDEKGQYGFNQIPTGKQTFIVKLPNKSSKEITIDIPGKEYNLEI